MRDAYLIEDDDALRLELLGHQTSHLRPTGDTNQGTGQSHKTEALGKPLGTIFLHEWPSCRHVDDQLV
jgi:hypothetical protein